MKPDPAAFTKMVDSWVRTALASGISSYGPLLRNLPSVYPTELLNSVDRLSKIQAVEQAVAAAIRREACARIVEPPQAQSLLPVPHPLNYEWRFAPDTSRALLKAMYGLTPPSGRILLLGTPGVAFEALSVSPERQLAFIGEDNAVTQSLSALNHASGSPLTINLCDASLRPNDFDAVLLDPPWYIDFIRPMLVVAAAACRDGGVLLLSLPPNGTRPSAMQDRLALLRFASRAGLEVLQDRPLSVSYDTPFFETNALSAAGIFAPARWRRGDLVMFRKARRAAYEFGAGTRKPSPQWAEAVVDGMRLFVRQETGLLGGSSELMSVIDGDILPSVSRRDPRRADVHAWTSGNRIFRTNNPELLLEAARTSDETLSRGQLTTRADTQALQALRVRLRALASREAHEERLSRHIGSAGAPLEHRAS